MELEHRRIACLTGPKNLTDTILRLKGYDQAYKDMGLPPPSDGVFGGDYMSDSGFDDMVYSDLPDVPLTTIRQSGYTMEYEAYSRAFQEINHETDNPV